MLIVQHIHWLHARAQLMRWQEEVAITTYEMQWIVRFFSHKSMMWAKLHSTRSAVAGQGAGAGAIAYTKHKQVTWEQLSLISDWTFSVLNNAYKLPL